MARRVWLLIVAFTVAIPLDLRASPDVKLLYKLPQQEQRAIPVTVAELLGKKKTILSRDLVEKILQKLTAGDRAQLDWLTIQSSKGERVTLPRVFFTKYPIRFFMKIDEVGFAFPQKDAQKFTKEFEREGIPLNGISLSGISEILFFNADETFVKFRSTKRSDPSVIRGEKGFIQYCLACHFPLSGSFQEKWKTEQFWDVLKHPNVPAFIELDPVLKQAMKTYWSTLAK